MISTWRENRAASPAAPKNATGADAVILQDVSRPAPAMTRLNPTTGMYENTGGQLVPAFKGIAIKYR